MNGWKRLVGAGGLLLITSVYILGADGMHQNLFYRSLGRESIRVPRDPDFGEIQSPENAPELFQTLQGFFQQRREAYADPASRRSFEDVPNDVIEIRMGKAAREDRFAEVSLRLIYFDRSSRVVQVVLRRDGAAPHGWYVIDFS